MRGHDGHALNERADALAFQAAQRAKTLSSDGGRWPTDEDPPGRYGT